MNTLPVPLGESWRPAISMEVIACPLALDKLSAGFPSPAQDYEEKRLDIGRYLVDNPVSTFFVRVAGLSMVGAEIFPGDILIVDRSKEALHRSIVVAFINGERTVKYLCIRDGPMRLEPANPDYPTTVITDAMDCVIWGVVTGKAKRFT